MFDYTHSDPSQVEYVAIGNSDTLSDGERLFVELGDKAIVVFNIKGEYYAIGDVCSHDEGPLGDGDMEAFEITCPRHGALFDIRTGKALQLPAVMDIPVYPVRERNGQIEIGIPSG
jgi:3-phenylpropionate/trans-cinnamate dioxygenase ferredoxin subunit